MSLCPPIDLHPCQWLRVELHWVHLSALCGFVIIVFCVMNINSYAVSHETGCSVVSVLLFPLRLVLKITLKLCSSIEAQQLADSHWVIVTGCWKSRCMTLCVQSREALVSGVITDWSSPRLHDRLRDGWALTSQRLPSTSAMFTALRERVGTLWFQHGSLSVSTHSPGLSSRSIDIH